MPDTNHTFTELRAQRELMACLDGWIAANGGFLAPQDEEQDEMSSLLI